MSTGPEHYREAERLLAACSGPHSSAEWIAACQGAAAVHAQLAMVAAHINTKAAPEFPLAHAPHLHDEPASPTWKDVIQ